MSNDISPIKKINIFNKYNSKCAYCGTSICLKTFHIDHIKPKSKGGTYKYDNLNPSCGGCNLSKSNRLLDEWRIFLVHDASKIFLLKSKSVSVLKRMKHIKFKAKDVVFYFEKLNH